LGKDVAKLKAKGGKFKYMSEKDMLELAAKFAPYRYGNDQTLDAAIASHCILTLTRSLFMWYMWRVEDVDITVMTG
jgi:DNA-3-methyladenine glycosylase II